MILNDEEETKACSIVCEKNEVACPFEECKYWIFSEKEYNCDLIAIRNNGPMTFREIGERLGISYVRVKQIETAAMKKITKLTSLGILED